MIQSITWSFSLCVSFLMLDSCLSPFFKQLTIISPKLDAPFNLNHSFTLQKKRLRESKSHQRESILSFSLEDHKYVTKPHYY